MKRNRWLTVLCLSLFCLCLLLSRIWLADARPGPDSNYNVSVSGGGGGCSQATTLLARMDGSENTSAVTTLICGMETDGTLPLMDVFHVWAINSTANAALNWVSTSYSITVNGTCTFNANQGYTGDGSSCYLSDGYNPSTDAVNYGVNSGSISICNYTAVTSSTQNFIGVDSGQMSLMQASGGDIYYNVNDSNFPLFAYSSAKGQWTAVRSSGTASALYQNGTSVATSAAASGAAFPGAQFFYLANNNGGTASEFAAAQFSYAFISGVLTGTQVTSVYNRIHTYLTAVGAPSGC